MRWGTGVVISLLLFAHWSNSKIIFYLNESYWFYPFVHTSIIPRRIQHLSVLAWDWLCFYPTSIKYGYVNLTKLFSYIYHIHSEFPSIYRVLTFLAWPLTAILVERVDFQLIWRQSTFFFFSHFETHDYWLSLSVKPPFSPISCFCFPSFFMTIHLHVYLQPWK